MDPHIPYILPLKGLGEGLHQFSYHIEDAFFKAFEDNPIQSADIKMELSLDKKASLLVLDFSFAGSIQESCDRCLAPIQLPVAGENRLLVKYGEQEEDEEEDVAYIPYDTGKWNIAQFVYEYILIAVPLIKVYNCEDDDPLPCDEDMLDKLDATNSVSEDEPVSNPFKDALKDWNK